MMNTLYSTKDIASQGKGSLLDGEGVSLIYAPADSVALNYGITGNQSDKLSSGHSANIPAQSLAGDTGCGHMTIPSAGGRDLNHVNDIHSVDCLAFRFSDLSFFSQASITHDEKFKFSRPTLELISSISSCGKRMPFVVDLLFLYPVAISINPLSWCRNTIQEIMQIKILDVFMHLVIWCLCTLFCIGAKIATPRSATNTNEAFNHNVKRSNTMAMYKSTQTHPKFIQHHSAKFYAGLKYETLSRPNPDIPNRGEITPFKGFIGVTTRGDIEFFQSIKKDCVEFLESIKKGSVSTTLCVFDIKYRANQPLQISQWLNVGISDISGEAENFDDNHLFLSSDVRYSDRAPAKSGVRIGVLNQLLATHDAPCVFFCVHAYAHLLNAVLYRAESMVAAAEQPQGWLDSSNSSNANSVAVTTPEIGVSSGDSLTKLLEIIVMMAIPTQTQFKFLFLAVKRADSTDIPHRIEATAPNEHSARLLLVRDYILSFAGRLPVREVSA